MTIPLPPERNTVTETKPYKAQPVHPDSEEWCVWVGDTYIKQNHKFDAECVASMCNKAFAQGLAAAATGEGEKERESHAAGREPPFIAAGLRWLYEDGVALKIATKPGHILTDDGAVRKVLGTLRHTKDGAVVQRGDWVFSSGSSYCVSNDYTIPLCVLNDAKNGYRDLTVEECYSDREASRAARAALKHGEGGK